MPGIPSPKVSTGTIATTSNPITPTGKVSSITVQAAPAEFNDVGTNAPVITLKQSQSTGPLSYDAAVQKANSAIPYSKTGGFSQVRGGDGPTQIPSGEKTVASKDPVIAKSSPADAGPTVQPATPAQPGRNKFFTNDFYIDDLEILAQYLDDIPTSSYQISFKITEPNGMTLLFALNNAVRDLYKQPTGSVQTAQFVMVIRFYGWDEKGNLITKVAPASGQASAGSATATLNNSNAVVVKYFPFTITELTFKNEGKVVEYHVKGSAYNYYYAQTTALGSVPKNLNLVGQTVEQILNGFATTPNSVSSDDSKRNPTEAPAQAKSPQTITQPTTVSDLKNLIFNPFGQATSNKTVDPAYNDAGY